MRNSVRPQKAFPITFHAQLLSSTFSGTLCFNPALAKDSQWDKHYISAARNAAHKTFQCNCTVGVTINSQLWRLLIA
jgi:hypothetical protein